MSFISLGGGAVIAGGTYYAIRNTSLPVPAKIGISLVSGTAGYFLVRKIEKSISGTGGEQVTLARTEAQEILKNNLLLPPGEQIKASYSKQQFKSYADSLETAMDGMGTAWEDMEPVFEAMNNDLDVLLLIEAFGVRDDENLTEWLEDDGVKEDANKILETKTQISKRF